MIRDGVSLARRILVSRRAASSRKVRPPPCWATRAILKPRLLLSLPPGPSPPRSHPNPRLHASLLQLAEGSPSARAAAKRRPVPIRRRLLERHGVRPTAAITLWPLWRRARLECAGRGGRVSKLFEPQLTLGERIAAGLGARSRHEPYTRSTASRWRSPGRGSSAVGESGCENPRSAASLRESFSDIRRGPHRRRAGHGRSEAGESARRCPDGVPGSVRIAGSAHARRSRNREGPIATSS